MGRKMAVVCGVVAVLWMTSCLAIIGQAKAVSIGHVLKMTHQAAAPA